MNEAHAHKHQRPPYARNITHVQLLPSFHYSHPPAHTTPIPTYTHTHAYNPPSTTDSGPALILLNKHILKDLDNGTGFNFPMFLSCLGLISSSLTAHIAVKVFGSKLPNQKVKNIHKCIYVCVCMYVSLSLPLLCLISPSFFTYIHLHRR